MNDNFAKELEAVSDMGKLTLMVPNLEPDYNISFNREGKTIGKLDFNGDEMKFIGEADGSAEVFFDWLANAFKGRLEKERAAEQARCIQIIENYQIHVGGSAAGEVACEMTYSALRQIRDEIKGVEE